MTYAYHVTLDDGEVIMLETALKMMIKKCDKELNYAEENGLEPKPPFWANKQSALSLLNRLHSDTEMMSFSYYSP